MAKIAHIAIITVFFSYSFVLNGQADSTRSKKCRRVTLISGSSVLAGGSLVYLDQAWYAQYNTGKFHTFNDNGEWLQMDKVGHAWTTYNTGRLMMDAFQWAGFNKKQKLLGGTAGLVYMTGIEIMDGYSAGWGFSWGDMGANALGAGLAIGQEALWNEQRIFIKYSYKESGLASQNPSMLGKNLQEKILKDYNAQTYWISCSPFSFFKKDKKVPRWLALSFGYGAQGMITARAVNTKLPVIGGEISSVPERMRNYYLSLDLDFTKIKTKSKVLKTVFACLNTVKVPFPTIGFNRSGTNFNWIR